MQSVVSCGAVGKAARALGASRNIAVHPRFELHSQQILRVPAGQGGGVLQLGGEADISQCVIALMRREGSGQSRQQKATETHTMERPGFLFAGGGEQVSANDASLSCN